ncbi:MAG TPA: TIGR03088 family PEP-CTERM/XrtA system glycosyltransferase [Hydrogenophaga sp.]|uniref:TIGR03088 family PEP-CTERM/XrtA system glycosyltransferase n=1 Tax=Hydrogenophaga sp. TaxID=1904254 RepID=UPI002CF6EC41|nr:TIGR03088 family PEP-CTERM/XrtA system glycosyltransferase [Hydrogenophaga sp.]HSX91826.1 TIGR03088 family PEP-CTERM/XrtA system glycosyltransferase [Hydrogenophaga sp.]
MTTAPSRPLRVLHVVYRFDIGGLENVIVELINRLPTARFEHVVLSLTTVGEFAQRVETPGVRFIALDKPPGHTFGQYHRIWRLMRELRPDVLHTCNIAPLEVVPVAWLAGVPTRVHVEHGWDAPDLQGENRKYRWMRRIYRPFVSHFVSVSADLDRYLEAGVGVRADRRSVISNGVDTQRFRPGADTLPPDCPFRPGEHWIVGAVGRMVTVKNQTLLARAFVRLLQQRPELARRARLVMLGDGHLKSDVEAILREAGRLELAWLPGSRRDVAEVLPGLDVFVLPSLAEGTSCTLQEAMACARPVLATAVGGTPDLIRHGVDGLLVPGEDSQAMADALMVLHDDTALAERLGAAARRKAVETFSVDAMVNGYQALFAKHHSVSPMPV